jgi:HSP20 family protein
MSIIKVDPFRSFDGVLRRMNDVFDDLQKGGIRFEVGDFSPRVDIADSATEVTLHAELPGLEKENVKITINEQNVLTIRGEKKREEKTEERNYMRVERSYGSFARSFALPDKLRTAEISASFNNGVLTITIPKAEPVLPTEQEITIQ